MPGKGKPFKPGQSGNPNGRPVGSGRPTFKGIIESLRAQNKGEWHNEELGAVLDNPYDQAALQLISAVQNGEPWAIKDFMDRGLGKAPLAVEISGPEGGPIEHDIGEDLKSFLDSAAKRAPKKKA
jgi:hypothetical protein